jgi:hypothetical protein
MPASKARVTRSERTSTKNRYRRSKAGDSVIEVNERCAQVHYGEIVKTAPGYVERRALVEIAARARAEQLRAMGLPVKRGGIDSGVHPGLPNFKPRPVQFDPDKLNSGDILPDKRVVLVEIKDGYRCVSYWKAADLVESQRRAAEYQAEKAARWARILAERGE